MSRWKRSASRWPGRAGGTPPGSRGRGAAHARGCRVANPDPGPPPPPAPGEPARVAAAAAELGWRHVVVTSVTRDDLRGGGAAPVARGGEEVGGVPSPPAVEL